MSMPNQPDERIRSQSSIKASSVVITVLQCRFFGPPRLVLVLLGVLREPFRGAVVVDEQPVEQARGLEDGPLLLGELLRPVGQLPRVESRPVLDPLGREPVVDGVA